MQQIAYAIDWSFEYPPHCTPSMLRKMLREKAGHWPGWEEFPWYLTRTLHRHMDGPPADWDHLHDYFWMSGLATHVLLKGKFEDRNAVLGTLIRHEVQFFGIFRHMVTDQIRWCLLFLKQTRLPDCALWGADTPGNTEALDKKRKHVKDDIRTATSEFIRVLNFACEVDDPTERIAGHPLQVWFRGAHMPEVVEVPVRMSAEDGRRFLRPEPKTAARFLSRRLPVPKIEASREKMELEDVTPAGRTAERTEDEEEARRRIAIGAFEMATRLDGGQRTRPPSHVTVLRLYCCEDMSLNAIARKCGCSHGTVSNRKGDLEKKLGMPLAAFRRHAAMLREAMQTAEDGRARNIYRRGLIG